MISSQGSPFTKEQANRLPVSGLPQQVPVFSWGIGGRDHSILAGRNWPGKTNIIDDARMIGGEEGRKAFVLRPSIIVARIGFRTHSWWEELPFSPQELSQLYLVIHSNLASRFRFDGVDQAKEGHHKQAWYWMKMSGNSGDNPAFILDIFGGKHRWVANFAIHPDQKLSSTTCCLSTRLLKASRRRQKSHMWRRSADEVGPRIRA